MKAFLTKLTFYRHMVFLITFIIVGTGLQAQLSQSQLEKFYSKKDTSALENIFFNEFQKTKNTFYKTATNDTLIRINELFNTVVLQYAKPGNIEYFFLQPDAPKILIDNNEFVLHEPFTAFMNDSSLRAMHFNADLMLNLLSFLGNDPMRNKITLLYISQKNDLSCFEKKKAKRLMNEYNSRLRFISGILHLPFSWGKMNRGMVPYLIKYIRFDKNMTKAKLEYDFIWCGAIVEYTLAEGKWVKTNVLLNWDQ